MRIVKPCAHLLVRNKFQIKKVETYSSSLELRRLMLSTNRSSCAIVENIFKARLHKEGKCCAPFKIKKITLNESCWSIKVFN